MVPLVLERAIVVRRVNAHIGVINGFEGPLLELLLPQFIFHEGLEIAEVLGGIGPVRGYAFFQLHGNPIALVLIIDELDGFGYFSGLHGVE